MSRLAAMYRTAPFDMRVPEAQSHHQDCRLCPFLCGTARATGDGVCRVGDVSYIASEMLHMGEEQELNPAHAIFLSGCTARCRFCIVARYAFRSDYGIPVTPHQLAERIVMRQEEGARSVCFIGGDPVPHIPFVLETLRDLGDRKRRPSVFNSNFYMTDAALDLLLGVIDIYLPDLKFGPEGCGDEIGVMPEYWRVVTGCIDRLLNQGERVIVRHLLMPGHFECCTEPVLRWLSERQGVQVSLLDQYMPPSHVHGDWAAFLSETDRRSAFDLAHRLDLHLVD